MKSPTATGICRADSNSVISLPILHDANIVFAGGWYRTVVRFDRRANQIATVFVPGTKYRSVNNAPMAFSPHDPRTLYYGTQFMMKTTDGGASWREISPDLTHVAGGGEAATPRAPAAITTFSVSPVQEGVIWAGTNNGVVQLTENDGTSWRNVSPSNLPRSERSRSWTRGAMMPGRHSPPTSSPTMCTRTSIAHAMEGRRGNRSSQGLPETAFVRVVREDPAVAGLLYCGTEAGVYVSIDAGDHWQSLQLNLPPSSMRDMVVHGDDLVLATYGRGLWILDNLTPIRQLGSRGATADLQLLKPRRRRAGAVGRQRGYAAPGRDAGSAKSDRRCRHRLLPRAARRIGFDDDDPRRARGRGADVYFRRASGDHAARQCSVVLVRAARRVEHAAGSESLCLGFPLSVAEDSSVRLLRCDAPVRRYTLADHAIPGRTPREQPEGAFALPGRYTVELSGGGHHDSQTLVVEPDPRVTASSRAICSHSSIWRSGSVKGSPPASTAIALSPRFVPLSPITLKALSGLVRLERRRGRVEGVRQERGGCAEWNRRSAGTRSGEPGNGAVVQHGGERGCTSLRAAADGVLRVVRIVDRGARQVGTAARPGTRSRERRARASAAPRVDASRGASRSRVLAIAEPTRADASAPQRSERDRIAQRVDCGNVVLEAASRLSGEQIRGSALENCFAAAHSPLRRRTISGREVRTELHPAR